MFILDYLPLAVTLVGGFMLIKVRAFFILRPLAVLRELKSTLKNKGTTRALCLALAGTLGVGNIVGVAVGLIVGGEGSVFWLLISSIFATVLKFSEASLSSDMACGDGGGMIPVLKNSFKRCGGALSVSCTVPFFVHGRCITIGWCSRRTLCFVRYRRWLAVICVCIFFSLNFTAFQKEN